MSEPELKSFRKSMLEPYKFPGTHAAVTFVAEGQQPSVEIQEVLSRSGQRRWYPVAGGHQVKIPWHFCEGFESFFEREEWGWDHEHCDFCNATINIGDQCWTADNPHRVGCFFVFCEACYEQVKEDRGTLHSVASWIRKLQKKG